MTAARWRRSPLMRTSVWSGARLRSDAGRTMVEASLMGWVLTLYEGTRVRIWSERSPLRPSNSLAERTSIGAMDSVVVRASPRVPVTTTSSSSRADSAKSAEPVPPAVNVTFCFDAPNPRSWAVTVYSPPARAGTEYEPSSADTVDWDEPVASLTTVTVAPGTVAPDESRTTPEMRPSVCAKEGTAARLSPAAINVTISERINRMGSLQFEGVSGFGRGHF